MKRIAAVGLSAGFAWGVVAISGSIQETEPTLELRLERSTELYERPNAIHEASKTLRAGQTVTAFCYYESATLGVDSISVESSEGKGYAFAWTNNRPNEPQDNFNASPLALKSNLRLCET
jgi:hypothetical protein